MQDILDAQHIMIQYNTVGSNFEQYLTPDQLITLSKVSKTTREGNINVKFRQLLDATMTEYYIFKTNNNVHQYPDLSYDKFFQTIPLGVMYKNYKLIENSDIYQVLDYLHCNDDTRLYVFIELCNIDDFKRYISYVFTDIDIPTLRVIIFQASIRLRDDIVEYLFNEDRYQTLLENSDYLEYYCYYPANTRLRQLYLNKFSEHINEIIEEYTPGYDPMSFGTINDGLEYQNYVGELLWLTTCFGEQNTFREYYLSYHDEIPQWMEDILNDAELKYNYNHHHIKLIPEDYR